MEGSKRPTTESLMAVASLEQKLGEMLEQSIEQIPGHSLNISLTQNWAERAERALKEIDVELEDLSGFHKVLTKMIELDQLDPDKADDESNAAKKFVAAQPGFVLAMLALAVVSRSLAAYTLDAVVESNLTTREKFEEQVLEVLKENPPFGVKHEQS